MGELRVRRGKYFWTRIGPTRAASLGSRGCTGPRSRPQRTQVKGAQMALRPDPHTRPSAEAARSHFLPFLVLAISGSFLSSGCITSSRKALGEHPAEFIVTSPPVSTLGALPSTVASPWAPVGAHVLDQCPVWSARTAPGSSLHPCQPAQDLAHSRHPTKVFSLPYPLRPQLWILE